MTNPEIIELLQQDIRGEHQAIVMYLMHAYEVGESGLAAEIEAIAREEMRHLDWLADIITGLGGEPNMEPVPPDFTAAPLNEQMLKDVALEEGAAAQYREHIEAIDVPDIRLLLSRILHDELAHHGMFVKFVDEVSEMTSVIEKANAEGATLEPRTADILKQGVRHEYTVTLQYLFHGFMTKDKDLAEDWQNIAINEMQHMGWLSEALTARGGRPDFTHTPLVLTPDAETNLKADIAVERDVTKTYSRHIPEVEDPGLAELLERIRDHEIYHDNQFSGLLDQVEDEEHTAGCQPDTAAPSTTKKIPTVGSLK
ncbi:MAG: ferritin-like domain-containing protein [Chloroflexi bacterium]|nr:ferritin-like domain-containing protein [Chloroflexota bacterium]